MASKFDPSDFVDHDYEDSQEPEPVTTAVKPAPVPSREELGVKVSEAQKKLTDLRRQQEELERERTELEESRRKQNEFYHGREEMLGHLVRGIEILKEAEQDSRRNAEQMSRTLDELKESLDKVSKIDEEGWTKETFTVELSKALAIIEHARMEWNTARTKWPVLTAAKMEEGDALKLEAGADNPFAGIALNSQNLRFLCKVGLALTWPLALVALLALASIVFFAISR